jgi:two-component system alkaline phosphatase synthesis response regulator PhoP
MSTENSLYKILLVDDEQDILDFLSYNLKKEGFQVYTALNGRDAINIAKKEIPHLIVLDVMMPEMNGIDMLRQLRQENIVNLLEAFRRRGKVLYCSP